MKELNIERNRMKIKEKHNRIICDICNQEINNQSHFKFKEHYASFLMGHFESFWGWYDRDMCNDCMKKLRQFVKSNKSLDAQRG